LFCLQLQSV
jgi:hypothetical protein